jgi:hypothetical protein
MLRSWGHPRPWFFAVGFFKPHLPFGVPKRWFDEHAEDTSVASATDRPAWPSG